MMKLCRFNDDNVGVVSDGRVFDVTELAESLSSRIAADDLGDPFVWSIRDLRKALPDSLTSFRSFSLDKVDFLSPVRFPGKIVAAPVNYMAHILEMQASNISPGHNIPEIGKAGLFLKATSSLVGPSQGIALRFPDRRTDHEIELVAIIGKTASCVSRMDALDHVAGYCLGLDITVRGTEDRSFRKSIDSYSVLGPWLTTADEIPSPNDLELTLRRNGDIKQHTSTADMIYDVARIIEFASSFYTLYPGDIVYTGTPQGVGPIEPGDRLHAECPALGAMSVTVRAYSEQRPV